MMRLFNVKVFLLISVCLCVATAFMIFSTSHKKKEAQKDVNHTYNVIYEALNLLTNLKEAERTQRGYIITSDSAYVNSCHRALASLPDHYKKLRTLTLDNTAQTELLDAKIFPLIQERISLINQTLVLYRSDDRNAAEEMIKLGKGKAIMDSLQINLTKLKLREENLLATRSRSLINIISYTEWLTYAATILIAGTCVLALITIRKVQKENKMLFDSLEHLNLNLQQKVEEQTRELVAKNKALSSSNEQLFEANKSLQASDEEIKAHLDQIIALQDHLEKSEKMYRLLSENSMDLIAVFGMDNKFEYVSSASRHILGYEPGEMIGKDGIEFIHPDDLQKLNTSDIPGADETPLNPHFRLKRKDGGYVWIETQSTPIVNDKGQVVGVQTSNRDITLRKEIEVALREAKAKAEEATKAKSAFLSMMSHEIRTPMNAIIGLTNILLQENPLPTQVESLKLLKFSGENLLVIINDILDFSKIEANKMTIEKSDFDLPQLLSNIIRTLDQRAKDKGIELALMTEGTIPQFVKFDQVRLNQILVNLIGNALKFTEKGSVKLIVQNIGTSEVGKNRLMFSVVDTGIGMEEDKLELIFESFSQATADTTRRFGGTGLGLSITKRLLNLMDSDLKVESKLNCGSTFTFSLTLENGKISADKTVREVNQQLSGPIKVLLVEDNKVNQIVAINLLKKWGITVEVANNGLEAVKQIKNKTFQVVLMDLQMPEMDGFEASKIVRAMTEPYFQTLPIIALTAAATADIKEKALASGMNDFITKPFQPEELRSKIGSYILVHHADTDRKKHSFKELDLYTEGDPDFKRELAGVIVKSIKELKDALELSRNHSDFVTFSDAIRKNYTSIKVLGHAEYLSLLKEFSNITTQQSWEADTLARKIDHFIKLSDTISFGLQEELTSI